MRNGSYAFPVILIALGAIFLINNMSPEFPVWRLMADYWPVLLIVFGVIRLVETLATFQNGGFQGNVTGRSRRMGWAWIPVVVIVGLALSVPSRFQRGWQHLGLFHVVNGVQIFGDEFDYPVSINTPAVGAKRIVLDGLRGNITVTGGDVNEIHVEGHKTIRAFDKAAADKAEGLTKVEFAPDGDAVFIRAKQGASDQSTVSLDLDITVPRSLNVEARGRSGDLTVNQISGKVDVSSKKGEVRLSDVSGAARLDVEHCVLVRATNVKGAMDIKGTGRDIQLDNVDGQVTINGRFSGTLDFRSLTKPLHFESDMTDLRVEKLPGSINMDLGDLRADNVVGPVRLVTHSRDVHLEDFSGPVEIDLGRGDIELKPAAGVLSHLEVKSREGNIEMALPASGAFDLRAATQQGEASNDFGDGVVGNTQGRAATLKSAKGVGAIIALNTNRGQISVRKLE